MRGWDERLKQSLAERKPAGRGSGISEWQGRQISRNRGQKQTQGYRQGLKSRGSSAAIDGDVVPEDRICRSSHLLPLVGREGGQESFEFVW
jgi:hypothetical protein